MAFVIRVARHRREVVEPEVLAEGSDDDEDRPIRRRRPEESDEGDEDEEEEEELDEEVCSPFVCFILLHFFFTIPCRYYKYYHLHLCDF